MAPSSLGSLRRQRRGGAVMPRRAPSPCSEVGCDELVAGGTGRCPKHKRAPWSDAGRKRASASERGYGWRWQKLRELILAREPLCRPCKQAGRVTPATEVDHVISKARGGTDASDNLEPICHDCHTAKTGRDRWSGAGGER